MNPQVEQLLKDWLSKGKFKYKGLTYIKGVNENSAKELLIKLLYGESEAVARKHFTTDYENLNPSYQHEWEGITWGWQDCVKLISKVL